MSSVILTGPENIQPWLHSLARRARHSGCHHVLFPSSTTPSSSSSSNSCRSEGVAHQNHHHQPHHRSSSRRNRSNSNNHSSGEAQQQQQQQHHHHLQGIADRLQRETACRLVRESVPGPIWAYMLTLVVDADELFADPALAVKMARVAATRAPDAPITDRDWYRLRYEFRGGIPDDYPTRAHYEQGQKWLDTVIKRHRLGQGMV